MEKRKSEVIDTMMALFDTEVNLRMFVNSEREQTRTEGLSEGRLNTILELVRDGDLSNEKAIAKIGISKATLERLLMQKFSDSDKTEQ